MAKGPAGYGRYDDDPARVGCPWARSPRSACVARDGQLALFSGADPVCRGCANSPETLAEELAAEYGPAGSLLAGGDPVTMADEFASMVREATEPVREGP
jgi:hypothetical protein